MKYPPQHHQEKDVKNVIEVARNYPFGTFITVKNNEPLITHIPMIYEYDGSEYGKLVAHIDKYNPQAETLFDGANVTAIFYGPDCYISPSLFSTSKLPTWNYVCAHLKGTIHLLKNKENVRETIVSMTSFLEGENPKYVLEKNNPVMNSLLDYIIGFEIKITNCEGKFKFSQDKTKKDQEIAKQELIRSQQKDVSAFIANIFENHKNASKL